MKRQKPGDAGGYAGYELNRPDGDRLVMLVGKLIVNCGGIELLTYIWIRELTAERPLFDVALDMPLGRRIDLIVELLKERGASSRIQVKAKKAWEEVKKLAETRNVVAHGPLAFGWNGPERPGAPPDFIGIPALKQMRRNKTGRIEIGQVSGLSKAVDRSAEIAANISDLLDEVLADVSQVGQGTTKSA